MRTFLRFLLLLLAWTGLGRTVAWAQQAETSDTRVRSSIPTGTFQLISTNAERTATTRIVQAKPPTSNRPQAVTANNVTATVSPGTSVQIANFSTTLTVPSLSVASYTIVTRPASGRLFAFNASNNTSLEITANNTNYSAATYPNLAYIAPATTGSFPFTYSATDNLGATSNQATYTILVAPTALKNTALILPASYGITALSQALSSTPASQSFIIKSLPDAASGVLYTTRNATGGTVAPTRVTVNQSLTAIQAANLSFDPEAAFFGTARFTFSAISNGVESAVVGYGIPVSKTTCGVGNALDFATRPTNPAENWAVNGKTATVEGLTITTSNYTTPVTAGTNTSLLVRDGATTNAPGTSLVWEADYGDNTATTQTITFDFNRAVKNFSFTVSDIDQILSNTANNGWTDELQVDGYSTATGGTAYTLTAADVSLGSNGTNTLAAGNKIQGQGNTNNDGVNGNVVITFPTALRRLTLTYRNIQNNAGGNPGGQFIGIHSFSWCAQADLITTIAPQTTPVLAGTTGQFNVGFSNAASLDVATNVTRTVQLPAGLTNVVVVDNGTTLASGAYNAPRVW